MPTSPLAGGPGWRAGGWRGSRGAVGGKSGCQSAPSGEIVERRALEQGDNHGGNEGQALHQHDRAEDVDLGHLLLAGEVEAERPHEEQRTEHGLPKGRKAL